MYNRKITTTLSLTLNDSTNITFTVHPFFTLQTGQTKQKLDGSMITSVSKFMFFKAVGSVAPFPPRQFGLVLFRYELSTFIICSLIPNDVKAYK